MSSLKYTHIRKTAELKQRKLFHQVNAHLCFVKAEFPSKPAARVINKVLLNRGQFNELPSFSSNGCSESLLRVYCVKSSTYESRRKIKRQLLAVNATFPHTIRGFALGFSSVSLLQNEISKGKIICACSRISRQSILPSFCVF